MHELPVTRCILDIVLRHAAANQVASVRAVDISVGALSDLEAEWIQQYFNHLSRGTVAEGARIRVIRSPLTFRLPVCSAESVEPRKQLDHAWCPACDARDASVVGGAGYSVESMKAQ